MSTWSFAISIDGALHIVDGELPAADNVLTVEVEDRGGLVVISKEDRGRLAQLLGDPQIKEVVVERGPVVADALEDALSDITRIMQRRIDLARGESDEEPTP